MAIRIENLVFSWPQSGSTEPLIAIKSFNIARSSQVFIHGESGCGKSTLLGLIAGIHPIQNGDIHILGHSLAKMSGLQRDRFRGAHIGYIFQQLNLLPYLSVLDNVLLAGTFAPSNLDKDAQHQWASSCLTKLNIQQEMFHQPASSMSLGQQQRVAIARALFNQPEIIIADEPTSALDEKNRHDFMTLLMNSCKELDATLVFVSHDHQLMPHFEHVLELGKG